MPAVFPPELSRLLEANGPASQTAWAAFLEAHSRLLLATARAAHRGGRADYDVGMDAYAYLLEQLQKDNYHRLRSYAADGRSKFTTWLVVVAQRLCVDFYRQRHGRLRDASSEGRAAHAMRRHLTELFGEELRPEAIPDIDAPTPERTLLNRERDRTLAAALGALEARDRLLVKLRFEDDLSAREISVIMRFQSPFHVYRRLTAVLAMLRRMLQDRGVQEPEA